MKNDNGLMSVIETKDYINGILLEVASTLKVVSKALENIEDAPGVICDASVVMDMSVEKLLGIVSMLEQ